jgi:pyrroline-5-carboxylate reductase
MTENVAVIGAGMMGNAVVKSLVKSGHQGRIIVADIQVEKLAELEAYGATTTSDNRKAASKASVIFLCVKPSQVQTALKEISRETAGKLVISIAAAVPISYLKQIAPQAHVVRAMPNIAAMVQASYTAYCCDDSVTQGEKEKVKALLDRMGLSHEVSEEHMDAVTALSGSGPGYLSIIAEALFYAGLKVGLPKDVALQSSAQAMLGTARLILELNETPAKIRDMVTTPGGTTVEAIYEVEGSGIRQALMRAVENAATKSRQIREDLTSTADSELR